MNEENETDKNDQSFLLLMQEDMISIQGIVLGIVFWKCLIVKILIFEKLSGRHFNKG